MHFFAVIFCRHDGPKLIGLYTSAADANNIAKQFPLDSVIVEACLPNNETVLGGELLRPPA